MRVRSAIPHRVLVALALLCTLLASCGQSKPAAPKRETIAIRGYAYRPADLTVAPGTAVTFTNDDATAHTATSSVPGFDTGTVHAGGSATITFTTPGSYTYYCQFHPFMRARATVSR
jgi:plastocyanin